jgi:hypothetical protein
MIRNIFTALGPAFVLLSPIATAADPIPLPTCNDGLLARLEQQLANDQQALANCQNLDSFCKQDWQSAIDLTLQEIAAEQQACQPQPVAADHISLQGMEVTQAIQDLKNSAPLIAGKTTWLRVYLDKESGSHTLTAKLYAALGGGLTATISPVASITVTAGESLKTRRTNWAKSLNFPLPAAMTASGKSEFQLISLTNVGSGNPNISCETCAIPTQVTFFKEPPLVVQAIGLSYTFSSPPQTASPRAVDYALLRSWLGRAYPVSSVSFWQGTVTSTDAWPFDCAHANAQLATIRANDVSSGRDAHTRYYGLVSDQGDFMRGCSDGDRIASGPTGPDWSKWKACDTGDTDGSYGDWYAGHELGHTLGRDHPGASATMGFCGETPADGPLDTNFPYPKGQIGDGSDAGYAGLDIGDEANGVPLRILWPTFTHDVMTYCPQPQWLSAYTYEGVRQQLLDENPGFHTMLRLVSEQIEIKHPVGPMVHVAAIVNLARGTGEIRFVTPVERAAPQKGDTNRAALVVRNGSGLQLSRTPVVLREFTDIPAGEDQTALVDAAVPFHPEMRQIDLVLDQNILARYRGTTSVPAAPRGLRFISTDIDQVLIWIPAVGSAGTVTYTVQTSDDGASWNTIAIDLKEPILTLTPDQASALKARVIATNGFRSAAPVVVDLVPVMHPPLPKPIP